MSTAVLNLDEGTIVIVGASDLGLLAEYTSSGYRLIAIMTEDQWESRQVEKPCQYGGTQWVSETEKMQKALLVLKLSADQTLSNVSEALNRATASNGELNKKIGELNATVAKQETELSASKERYEELCGLFRAQNEREVTLRKGKQQLEADIGKIRAAVGEIRMKEILGGDAK